jgi:DNA-binding NtrC family response regulator
MKPILIVDDEKNIRLIMSQALQPLNVEVQSAENGEEALQKLHETSFGLVCLDLNMPGIDGLQVLRQIEEQWPEIRVIMVTAHGTIDSAVEAMKHGAVDFIQKPFKSEEIQDLARKVLERDQLNNETAVDYPSMIELTKRYIGDHKFDFAREMVQKAIASDPSQPEAYNLYGALLEINGDRLEALKFYHMAIDADPTFMPARENLERATSENKIGKIELGPEDTQPQ